MARPKALRSRGALSCLAFAGALAFAPHASAQLGCQTVEYVTSAPGRAELIGNYMDTKDGSAIAIAIPQRTTVRLCPRTDGKVVAHTTFGGELKTYAYELGKEAKITAKEAQGDKWANYIMGVTYAMRKGVGMGPNPRPVAGVDKIKGFDIFISSEVPAGGGLSSSAALEMATLRNLRQAYNLDINDIDLTELGRKAEGEFVGGSTGILDQMGTHLADAQSPLAINFSDLSYNKMENALDGVDVVILNSGVKHDLAEQWATLKAEIDEGFERLKKLKPGIRNLQDVTIADMALAEKLDPPYRERVKHLISENYRVKLVTEHFQEIARKRAKNPAYKGEAEYKKIGKLLYESHGSSRDLLGNSDPALDFLVNLARHDPELAASVYGARLSGGGFGGSVILLAKKGKGQEVAQKLKARYDAKHPQKAEILVAGARAPCPAVYAK